MHLFFFFIRNIYIYSITEFLTRTKNTINLLTSSLDINRPRTPKSMKKKKKDAFIYFLIGGRRSLIYISPSLSKQFIKDTCSST